jgi:glycerophosphoryl diester phosphodiesterase
VPAVRPRLLAHRGRRAAGPENSGRSVVAAFDACDGAEVDVLVTADGVPVLRHDDRLADGAAVRSLPLADLRRAVGGDPDDTPRVEDVLAALEGHGAPDAILNLELKAPGAALALRPLRALLGRVVFTSFHAVEVLDARAAFPERPAGLLVSHAAFRFVPQGAALLAVQHRALPEVRRAFPDTPLWTWTVNDVEAAARATAAGAVVWIGDDADAMAAWRT